MRLSDLNRVDVTADAPSGVAPKEVVPSHTVTVDAERRRPGLLSAALFLLACAALSCGIGKTSIGLETQAQVMFKHLLPGLRAAFWVKGGIDSGLEAILWDIRLPRVALALLVGGALSVAGAAYQGMFRNPLADPYLIGVASGAGLGGVMAFVLPFPAAYYSHGITQILAFAGAISTVVAVYVLSRSRGSAGAIRLQTNTLILSGVAIGGFLNAMTSYLIYEHSDKTPLVYSWMLGGFNIATWEQARLIAPEILLAALVLIALGRATNALQLGEDHAFSMGIPVERVKFLIIAAATVATAAAVSVSGLIGFVGLVVPHTVRMIWGGDYRLLYPVSLLCGAGFLALCDTAARSLPGPGEIPVGVITATLGAPFFLWLLSRHKRNAGA